MYNRFWTGPAVKGIMVATIIAFFAQSFLGAWMNSFFGLVPVDTWSRFYLWQFFTYSFLHGGFWHIFFNMFTLWMFGKELEYTWGTREFLKFYFICSIGAGLTQVLFSPFSALPVIGASGAVYGILVAFAVLFPETTIYLYGVFPIRSRYFVMMMVAIEFMASLHGSPSPIARFAHLGGMATGYLYLKSYRFRSFWSGWAGKLEDTLHSFSKKSNKQDQVFLHDLNKEVDRILEKVLLHGADSLTAEEREIMRRYSSRNQ